MIFWHYRASCLGSALTLISYKTTLHFQNFCHISPLCLPCHPTLARSGCLSGRGGRVGVTQDNSKIRSASATNPFLFHIFSSKKKASSQFSSHLSSKQTLPFLSSPPTSLPAPTSDYIGREMEQFCHPRHFLDLFDHIRPISMHNRPFAEWEIFSGRAGEMAAEMNEQKILALPLLRPRVSNFS